MLSVWTWMPSCVAFVAGVWRAMEVSLVGPHSSRDWRWTSFNPCCLPCLLCCCLRKRVGWSPSECPQRKWREYSSLSRGCCYCWTSSKRCYDALFSSLLLNIFTIAIFHSLLSTALLISHCPPARRYATLQRADDGPQLSCGRGLPGLRDSGRRGLWSGVVSVALRDPAKGGAYRLAIYRSD